MHQFSTSQLAAAVAANRRRKRWYQLVALLMAIVVFWTTYALILPAITVSHKTYCGLEEHTHTAACYATVETDTQSSDDVSEVAVEVSETTDAEGVTGNTDDASDTFANQNTTTQLVCGKEEHTHTDQCFTEPDSLDFTFTLGNVEGTVSVPYSDDLPSNLECTVSVADSSTDEYDAARDAASETTDATSEMLTAAQVLQLEWTSDGEVCALPDDTEATVTLDVSGVEKGDSESISGVVLEQSAQDDPADADAEGVTGDDSDVEAVSYSAIQSVQSDDAGLITLSLQSVDAPIVLMSSSATTTTEGYYYKRIDSVSELESYLVSKNYSTSRFVIVFANSVTMFVPDTSCDNWYSAPVEVQPIKGYDNEGYARIMYIYAGSTYNNNSYCGYSNGVQASNPSAYPQRHFSISHGYKNWAGSWIDFGSQYFFCLGNSSGAADNNADLYKIGTNNTYYIGLERDESGNVWRVRCNNSSGTFQCYLGCAKSGTVYNAYAATDSSNLGETNVQIYVYTGGSLEIPNDITAASEISQSAPEQWSVDEYADYVSASDAQTGTVENTTVATDATLTYASDASTSDIESQYGSNGEDYSSLSDENLNTAQQQNDGKILTDKSVIYGKDDYGATSVSGYGSTTSQSGYDEGDFSVTLSALGQEWQTTDIVTETAPLDVVYVLDVSRSMNEEDVAATFDDGSSGNIPRWYAAANAINDSMSDVLSKNPLNRVGLVTFSNIAKEVLPLDRYSADSNGEYLQYDSSTFTYEIYVGTMLNPTYTNLRLSSGVTYSNDSAAAIRTGSPSEFVFNFDGAWDKTNTQVGIQEAYNTFLEMANLSSDYLKCEINGETVARQPVIILVTDGSPTICSFNYMYPQDGPFYGDGSDKGVDGYYTVLSAQYFKNLTGILYGRHSAFFTLGISCDDAYTQAVLDPTADKLNACESSSDTTKAVQLYNLLNGVGDGNNGSGGTFTDETYTTYYYDIPGVGYTANVIRGVYNPYLSSGFDYCDRAWLGSMTYEEMSSALSTILNTVQLINRYDFLLENGSSLSISDSIGSGMAVKGTPCLRYFGKNYAPTSSSTSTSEGVLITVYKWELTLNRQKSDSKGSKKTDTAGPVLSITGTNAITATLTTATDGTQTLVFNVPEGAMPTYYPDLYEQFYYEELPVRLIYRVGLSASTLSELSASTATLNRTFYTTQYSVDSAGSETVGTVATFTPDASNKYYNQGGGTAVSVKSANTSGTSSNSFTEALSVGSANIVAVTQTLGNNGVLTVKRSANDQLTIEKSWPEGAPSSVSSVYVSVYRCVYTQADGSDAGVSLAAEPYLWDGKTNVVELTSAANWTASIDAPLSGVVNSGTALEATVRYEYYIVETPVDRYTSAYVDSGGKALEATNLIVEAASAEQDVSQNVAAYRAAVNETTIVRNLPAYTLPATGGPGPAPFVAGGLSLIVFAAFSLCHARATRK